MKTKPALKIFIMKERGCTLQWTRCRLRLWWNYRGMNMRKRFDKHCWTKDTPCYGTWIWKKQKISRLAWLDNFEKFARKSMPLSKLYIEQ
mmetsp:Transcript_35850/g.83579  ORF Transcript_35850/g.83579 Transcript_35850/m.83579 type:complete len:90 (+) Transcript_35850:1223-1492(+)